MTAKRRPKQLGQMLLERGLLTQQQLDGALQEHRNTPKSLGRTLIDLGYIRERDLVRALAEQVGLDFVDLSEHQIDPVAATLLPGQLARRYRAIPIGERDGKLLVAMSDPANVYALDDIRAVTSREVQPVVATASDVERAIDKFAETLLGDLFADSPAAEGTAPGEVRSILDERTAVHHARAVYAAAESQAGASLPRDAGTGASFRAAWPAMDGMDEIAPGLGDELKEVAAEIRGFPQGATQPMESRLAALHARAVYAAAEMQARSSRRLERSTERLVSYTKWLAIATGVLAATTIVLAVMAARS